MKKWNTKDARNGNTERRKKIFYVLGHLMYDKH